MILKWRNRSDVHIITTFYKNKTVVTDKVDFITQERRKKLLCVVEYNERMGGVDRVDMM